MLKVIPLFINIQKLVLANCKLNSFIDIENCLESTGIVLLQLNVSHNPIGLNGLYEIVKSKFLSNLTDLSAWDINIKPIKIQSPKKSYLSCLTNLNLSLNPALNLEVFKCLIDAGVFSKVKILTMQECFNGWSKLEESLSDLMLIGKTSF